MGGFFVSDSQWWDIGPPLFSDGFSDRFQVKPMVNPVAIFSLRYGILTTKFGAITPFLDAEKCSNSPEILKKSLV